MFKSPCAWCTLASGNSARSFFFSVGGVRGWNKRGLYLPDLGRNLGNGAWTEEVLGSDFGCFDHCRLRFLLACCQRLLVRSHRESLHPRSLARRPSCTPARYASVSASYSYFACSRLVVESGAWRLGCDCDAPY